MSKIEEKTVSETLKKPISPTSLKIIANLASGIPKDIDSHCVLALSQQAVKLASEMKDVQVSENDILDSIVFIITHFIPLGNEISHLVQIAAAAIPFFWKLICEAEEVVEETCKKNKWCCF
jgi:hypothetical protein